MAILIDPPRWWLHDRCWSHLASDISLGELHDFAERVGIPRRGFHGDHYDVPEEYRDELLAAGAIPVESRELLRRLRAAGLRLTPAQRRRQAQGLRSADVIGVTTMTTNEEEHREDPAGS